MSKVTDAKVTEVAASLTKTIEAGAELFRCALATWAAINAERAVGAVEKEDASGMGYASAAAERSVANAHLNASGYWTVP